MQIISLLFFFSGLAALTYEVLWTRHLGLIFGNTVYAATTVMTSFMFGLAAGSHFAGKWARRIKRPIRCFGLLELSTALYALAVPLLFRLLEDTYRLAALHVSGSLPFLTALRFVLALLLVLVPTAMMGATLPVLSKGFLERTERFGARLGLLYGINTLGAVAGVLCCGFVFIPNLGMTGSNLVAVGLDAAVGTIALLLSRRMEIKLPEDAPVATVEEAMATAPRSRAATWLLLAIGASGFLSLAFEVVWFRAMILIFGSTTYSFSAMLGVFLVGLSLGSAIYSRFADRVRNPALVFGFAGMLTGLYTLVSLSWFGAMPEFLLRNLMLRGTPHWGTLIMLNFVITLIFLLAPTMFFGIAFTAAIKAIRAAMDSSPHAVGESCMFNTVGAAIGAAVGGFIFLPSLGMEGSLSLCAFLALLLGLSLCMFAGRGWAARGASASLAAFFVLAFFTLPHKWDRHLLSSGPYFSPWNYVKNGRITLHDELQTERLLYFNEGITSTIAVVQTADEHYSYCSQGKVEADTSARSMMLQRMMGHLPMLFHPNPQRALNIGLGAGVTFGAVACYPAKHLEVVEFEPSVVNVARVWKKFNHDVIDDPRIKVTFNDGRNHLFVGGKPYDVITSDPFEPVMAGAANLYTVDFFEEARAQLTPGGIMAQYLPLYELSNDDYRTIMRSFTKVFPNCLLFFTGFDTIMLGENGDAPLSLPIAREKFAIPTVRESLAEIGFDKPEAILSMLVARLKPDDEMFAGGKLNTDDHPVIEFSAPKSTLHYTPDANQQALLDHFSPVPAFLLQGLDADQRKTVEESHEALRTTLRADLLRATNNLGDCIRMLMAEADKVPSNPVVRNELVASLLRSAQSVADGGDLQQAALQYQLILKYNPEEFWALENLVVVTMKLGNPKAAEIFLQAGLKHYPESPIFQELRGKYRGTMGDLAGAIADISAALAKLPDYAEFWKDQEVFLRQKGDLAAAEHAHQQFVRCSD